MDKKNTARVYLMSGNFDEPFSIGDALFGPATDSHLVLRQKIPLYGNNGALVQVSPLRQTNEKFRRVSVVLGAAATRYC